MGKEGRERGCLECAYCLCPSVCRHSTIYLTRNAQNCRRASTKLEFQRFCPVTDKNCFYLKCLSANLQKHTIGL